MIPLIKWKRHATTIALKLWLRGVQSLEMFISMNKKTRKFFSRKVVDANRFNMTFLTILVYFAFSHSPRTQNTGPHREMAVDVPDSFIARNKTPPRYPPPRPPTQVIYTPNGSQKQPLLSTSSATSSLKSGSSSIGNGGGGGVALDLQPPSFNNSTTTTNTHVNNNHAIINTNLHHSNNNHHMKNSTSSFDSCNIEFSNKKSSSVKCPSSMGSVCESIGFDSMSYRTKSRGSLSTRSSSSGGELGPPEYDLGPHREMAVDVPDNFVGVTKMPPRYPKSIGGSGSSGTANALQKSKESLTSTNSTSTTNEKDAIIPSATNSQTINNITTPQTPNRNSEVFFFIIFVLFLFYFMFTLCCWFKTFPFFMFKNFLLLFSHLVWFSFRFQFQLCYLVWVLFAFGLARSILFHFVSFYCFGKGPLCTVFTFDTS